MDEDRDPEGIAQWPKEFLLSGDDGENETWSLALVENGLRAANLGPLANHLRSGFAVPSKIAKMLADAIERHSEAVCSITASHPTAGNPHNSVSDLHSRDVAIGLAYKSKLRAAKRGETKGIKADLADEFGVSVSTVRDAVAYTDQWAKGLSDKP